MHTAMLIYGNIWDSEMTKAETVELRECIELLNGIGKIKLSYIQHYTLLQIMKKLRNLAGE